MVAKVFHVVPAIPARAVGPANPGNAHAAAKWKFSRGTIDNLADYLVSRNHILYAGQQFAFDDMQIRPANSAGTYF
jgi:hypothetical protein